MARCVIRPEPVALSRRYPSGLLGGVATACREKQCLTLDTMTAALAERVDRLLSELCSSLGYCNAHRHAREFEAVVPQGVDAFSNAVLAAEGVGSEVHTSQVKLVVARHFAQWASANGA